jgi:ribosomal protein L2
MIKDLTLQSTMRAIADQYGFKARYDPFIEVCDVQLKPLSSERKWKEKLKEWKFDKNISSNDMSAIVLKAEKRAREEGKETIFFHGGTEITRERIEQFKRRKINKENQALSQEAGRCNS